MLWTSVNSASLFPPATRNNSDASVSTSDTLISTSEGTWKRKGFAGVSKESANERKKVKSSNQRILVNLIWPGPRAGPVHKPPTATRWVCCQHDGGGSGTGTCIEGAVRLFSLTLRPLYALRLLCEEWTVFDVGDDMYARRE